MANEPNSNLDLTGEQPKEPDTVFFDGDAPFEEGGEDELIFEDDELKNKAIRWEPLPAMDKRRSTSVGAPAHGRRIAGIAAGLGAGGAGDTGQGGGPRTSGCAAAEHRIGNRAGIRL